MDSFLLLPGSFHRVPLSPSYTLGARQLHHVFCKTDLYYPVWLKGFPSFLSCSFSVARVDLLGWVFLFFLFVCVFLCVCIWVLFFLLMFPCRNHLQDRWPVKLLGLSLTNTCLRQLGIKEEFSSFNALKEKQHPIPICPTSLSLSLHPPSFLGSLAEWLWPSVETARGWVGRWEPEPLGRARAALG